jgi:hypothetical protein
MDAVAHVAWVGDVYLDSFSHDNCNEHDDASIYATADEDEDGGTAGAALVGGVRGATAAAEPKQSSRFGAKDKKHYVATITRVCEAVNYRKELQARVAATNR